MATFINGELEVESGIPAGSQISYNGGSNRSAIGAYLMSNSSNPDGHFNGTIRELIVMNSLDEVQVSKIEGYLAPQVEFCRGTATFASIQIECSNEGPEIFEFIYSFEYRCNPVDQTFE